MKLNEYIHKNIMQVAASIETCWKEYPERAITEEEIEEWIVEWYMGEFTEGVLVCYDHRRQPYESQY
jgi:hypothetical protein